VDISNAHKPPKTVAPTNSYAHKPPKTVAPTVLMPLTPTNRPKLWLLQFSCFLRSQTAQNCGSYSFDAGSAHKPPKTVAPTVLMLE